MFGFFGISGILSFIYDFIGFQISTCYGPLSEMSLSRYLSCRYLVSEGFGGFLSFQLKIAYFRVSEVISDLRYDVQRYLVYLRFDDTLS